MNWVMLSVVLLLIIMLARVFIALSALFIVTFVLAVFSILILLKLSSNVTTFFID